MNYNTDQTLWENYGKQASASSPTGAVSVTINRHGTANMRTNQFLSSIEHNLRGVHFFSVGACMGCDDCGLALRECRKCDGAGSFFEGTGENESEIPCDRCEGKGTIEPTERDRESVDEGSFSWSSCDSCGSALGGNRYPAHGVLAPSMEEAQKPEQEITHFDVCADCLFYHANGDLPDTENE